MLASVWSNETIDDNKITVYLWVWEPFPYPAMEAAAKRYLGTGKFFPKPADLLELVAGEAVPEISHGAAWQEVQRQINAHGAAHGDRAVFDHPAVGIAVAAVGWKRLCLEETKYIVGEFNRALDAAQERTRREVQAGSVPLGSGNVVSIQRGAAD